MAIKHCLLPSPAPFQWQNMLGLSFAPKKPHYVKLILALGLAYIVSPWDLVPEWLPVIGVLDDFALAALLISWTGGFKEDIPR